MTGCSIIRQVFEVSYNVIILPLTEEQPVFFVRDPLKFPSMNRSHKRHPGTNSVNADMFWDFHVNNQEVQILEPLCCVSADNALEYPRFDVLVRRQRSSVFCPTCPWL